LLKGTLLAAAPVLALGLSTFIPRAGQAAPQRASERAPELGPNPFTLGVASGEPLPTGVELWTRLAPDPLNGGGAPQRPLFVHWEVAADERFRRVVDRGITLAVPYLAHSVHVEVNGLRPGAWYWNRFKAGSHLSPVGRTRTAPAPRTTPESLRFAFASCQDWQGGFYPAYQGMAREDLHTVVHLGDGQR
jgi:alkaline phosphatase D